MEAKIFVLYGDLKSLQKAYRRLKASPGVRAATIYPIDGKNRMMVGGRIAYEDVLNIVNDNSVIVKTYERAK